MLRDWVTTFGVTSGSPIRSRQENMVISQVYQSMRRGAKEGLASLEEIDPETLASLEPAITRTWATMLGNDWE